MEKDSKEFSWEWVTGSLLLHRGPCELVCAYLVPAAATTDTVLYDGTDTAGRPIVTLKAAAVTGHPFKPPVPAYCRAGLYVSLSSNATGVFVQWRGL